MSDRIKKVNTLIKQQVSDLLTRELSLKPGVFLTITKVDTTADLRYTRIFISIFPEKEISYAKTALEKGRSSIQKVLHKKLHMRPLPKIEFVTDMTESEADKIEKILQNL